jgi:hypothetical protein
MIDSKFFINCFLAIIAFCESEELFEIKSNDTLKGQTKQLFSDYFENCNGNYDCLGNHQVCLDLICRCAPNYKYDYVNRNCKRFYCYYDSECKTYDYYRYCSNQNCICVSGYVEDTTNGNKCKYSYTPSTEYDFTWVWILILILILMIPILGLYIGKRRRQLAAVRAANLQPVTIAANSDNGTTAYQTNYFPACYPQIINDPPPPYSIR